MTDTPFIAELRGNIRRTIKSLRASGTCAMSLANLIQVTPTPKPHADEPPTPKIYRELFAEIVESSRSFSSFIL